MQNIPMQCDLEAISEADCLHRQPLPTLQLHGTIIAMVNCVLITELQKSLEVQ